MYLDCCVRQNADCWREVCMDTIFYIDGDPSYYIPRKVITPGKCYLVYTLAGEGTLRYDGLEFSVRKNQLLLMRPQRDFSYYCSGQHWRFWWFEFWGDIGFAENQVITAPGDELVFNMLSQSLTLAKFGSWDAATALMLALCEMLRHIAMSSRKALCSESFVSALETYIRSNLSTVTVAELCQAFDLEERTLRNQCSRATGLSPKALIHKLRLEICAHLLLSTDMNLEQIAQQIGFSSPYHLSNCFKKQFGLCPRQYRAYIDNDRHRMQ